jgi:hypothetical protein
VCHRHVPAYPIGGPSQSGVARQMAFYADCFPRSWREAPRGVCPGVTFAQRNGSELATSITTAFGLAGVAVFTGRSACPIVYAEGSRG